MLPYFGALLIFRLLFWQLNQFLRIFLDLFHSLFYVSFLFTIGRRFQNERQFQVYLKDLLSISWLKTAQNKCDNNSISIEILLPHQIQWKTNLNFFSPL